MCEESKIFDFGSINYKDDRIAMIEINNGVEVDKETARLIISELQSSLMLSSVIIVNKKFDYSYATEAMMILNDVNLPNVIATAIVVHNEPSEVITKSQVNLMKSFGRSNMKMFDNEALALSWAREILQTRYTDT